MHSGVNILCKKHFGQFLAPPTLYCVINNTEVRELLWEHLNYIPLFPNAPYHLTIQFKYLGNPTGIAPFVVMVLPGEVQVYEYHTPFTIFSPGKLRRLQ